MAKKRVKKKQKYGDGTYRMRNGKLEYRFHYRDEAGQKRRKSVTGMNELECLNKAEVWIESIERKRRGIDMEATIPDLLYERHRADYEKNYVREQGYGRNIDNVKRIEKSSIGRTPIAQLDLKQMELFLHTMTEYSNSVISKIYRQVRLAFEIAKERGIIEENIMLSRELRCPRSRKENVKVKGLTVEEQKRLIDVLESKAPPRGRNDYRLQLFIELYSGMRMGEINALRKKDIDLKKGIVHVRGTVSKGIDDRIFIKTGAKTDTGVRDIPISKKLEPYLKEALKKMKENPEGLAFYDYNKGAIITTGQVNCYYHRICKDADIPCMGQHALRHTFATRCIESGIPAVVLKSWLGHKDIHMTLDIYTDVFNSMNHGAVDKFDDYLDTM